MKNKKYIGKKIAYILLAAILMSGNMQTACQAEGTDAEALQEQMVELSNDLEQEKIIWQEESKVEIVNNEAENTKLVSVSTGAIDIVSGGGLKVESLSIKILKEKYDTDGKHPKLNFSYKLLGCVKVDSHLNVRKNRSTEAKITGKLSNNTFCKVLEIYNNGWVKIKSGKVSGYVSADYLLIGEKAEQQALKKAKKTVKIKNTSVLNVRSLPSTKARVYGQIKKKNNIRVKSENVTKKYIKKLLKKNKRLRRQLGTSGRKQMLKSSNLKNWICVKYSGKTAFVSKDYAKVVYTVKTGTVESKKSSSLSTKVVKYAKKFLGNRYVYGGSSLKHGTDCSGFVMRIYQHFGYHLARSSAAQARNGKKVKRSNLKPGDLLFYKSGGRISHVSMYIGNNKVIHASNEKNGIIISSVYYRKACRCVRVLKG